MTRYLQLQNKKWALIFTCIILISIFSIFVVFNKKQQNTILVENKRTQENTTIISYKGKQFLSHVSKTNHDRNLGLSIFNVLPENESMLFIFDNLGIYSFWMKDMKFPIDIVWLDENKRIVYMQENAHPDDFPNTYSPTNESLYVLEFNAGFVKREGLSLGGSFSWQ